MRKTESKTTLRRKLRLFISSTSPQSLHETIGKNGLEDRLSF